MLTPHSVWARVFVRFPILSDFTAESEYVYAPETKKNKTSVTPEHLHECDATCA